MSSPKIQHPGTDLQPLPHSQPTELCITADISTIAAAPDSLSPLPTPLRSKLSSSSSDFDSMFATDPGFAIRVLREYADHHGGEGIRCLEAKKGVESREIGLHEDARIMRLSEEEFIVL